MPREHSAAPLTRRRGLTLIELMISIAVSAVLVGTMSVLAESVRTNATFSGGQNMAVQHAQVVLQRIQRLVNDAYATETYPGVVVVDETVNSFRYPTKLVVWKPSGTPVNPAGPPLISELVIVCPNPSNPGELCEITAANDTRTVQLNETSLNTSTGRALITAVTTATTSVKTQLTPMLRSAATATTASAAIRGCIRFECELHPTTTELATFRGGTGTWTNLNWVQDVDSSSFGLRQVWLRTEIQLLSEPRNSDGSVPTTASTLPFFGSSAIYYPVAK